MFEKFRNLYQLRIDNGNESEIQALTLEIGKEDDGYLYVYRGEVYGSLSYLLLDHTKDDLNLSGIIYTTNPSFDEIEKSYFEWMITLKDYSFEEEGYWGIIVCPLTEKKAREILDYYY